MKRIQYLFILIFIFFISCERKYFPVFEGRYTLDKGAMNEIYLTEVKDIGTLRVKGHILFFANNSQFIITQQKSNDSISGLQSLTAPLYDKKIYESRKTQFSILNVRTDSVYGPFNKEEYLKKRDELQVPKNLKLNISTLQYYIKDQRNDIQYKKPDSSVVNIKTLKGNIVSKMF